MVAKIAGGGMGTIYLGRARDPKGIERVVAIKVTRQDVSLVHYGGDLASEAKILSRLTHPNIIRTHESGTTADQQFIAMELLVGRTLLDVWDACASKGLALRLDLSAWIAARVAHGLHYAHELTDESGAPLHVIHRDVNPSNIFLTFDGEVKLFDFGLANVGDRSKNSGVVHGKLAYLSPEQIMQFPMDRRSDLYTLGTTLWEMTTMRRLFKRATDVETVKAVRGAVIPDARKIVNGYPDELWRIVNKALERNRDNRYATAAELAEDLDAFVGTTGDADLHLLISAILDSLFPEDRARQMGWLRRTSVLPTGDPRPTQPPLPSRRPPGQDEAPARKK